MGYVEVCLCLLQIESLIVANHQRGVFLALNTSERGVQLHWRFAGHSFGAFYRAMLAANTITEMVAAKSGRVTILFLAKPINQKITSIKH